MLAILRDWKPMLAAAVVAFALPHSPVCAQVTTQVIAISGDAAPDGNGSFAEFTFSALNDAGQVLFNATLTGTSGGTDDDTGLFRAGGATVQIVREGQLAPDGNGQFTSMSGMLNNAGQVGIYGTLTGNETGIFRFDGTAPLAQVARRGQVAPGGFQTFIGFTGFDFNNAGQTSFKGGLNTGGLIPPSGFFRNDGATTVQIIREGQFAPDASGANNGRYINLYQHNVNEAGQVAFLANLSNTTGGGSNNSGIWRGDGTTTIQVVREGQAPPDGNGVFGRTSFDVPFNGDLALNDSGQVAFNSFLINTSGGGNSDNNGIYVADGTSPLVQIVRSGQAAPDGNGAFGTLQNFGPPFSIGGLNSTGQVAFFAGLIGTSGGNNDNLGVYRGDGQTPLVEMARAGQTALDGDGQFQSFGVPGLNDAGQSAFDVVLTNNSGGFNNRERIYFFDESLGLREVARQGGSLLGSTIVDLGTNTTRLNELGQVAYHFALADGRRGIALATVDVPEPIDYLLTVEYRTPEVTGPLIPGFDPLPPTITAQFTLSGVAPGQTTIGLDQVISFDLTLPGGSPARGDLDSFELALDANGVPTSLLWNIDAFNLDPGVIILGNNNFMLEITGTAPDTQEEFRYFWSESTNTYAPVEGPIGDYNDDRTVNAADYTVWRDNLGATVALPNDPLDGPIGPSQYDNWRSNFGATAGSGATVGVPEPVAWVLVVLAIVASVPSSLRFVD